MRHTSFDVLPITESQSLCYNALTRHQIVRPTPLSSSRGQSDGANTIRVPESDQTEPS